jgi:hypothetical protein
MRSLYEKMIVAAANAARDRRTAKRRAEIATAKQAILELIRLRASIHPANAAKLGLHGSGSYRLQQAFERLRRMLGLSFEKSTLTFFSEGWDDEFSDALTSILAYARSVGCTDLKTLTIVL